MSRRRTVVLASGATLLGLAGLVLLVMVILTRTGFGRGMLRDFVVTRVNNAITGKFYLGRLSGSIFTEVVADSIEVRDANDSLLFASGRIAVGFDPRDLMDRRILLSHLRATNPHLRLVQDTAGKFNFQKIFPSGPPDLSPGPRPARTWGDFIAVNTAQIDNLTVELATKWTPPSDLRGARLDSAIAFNLEREDKIIRRHEGGFVEVRRWSEGHLELGYSRFDAFAPEGRYVDIKQLDIIESDPPLAISNATGRVRLLGDSLIADISRFQLPGSGGRLAGKVVWGGDGPVRLDINVEADSVSLADIAWVYPTLPRTGGGRLRLAIHNAEDPDIIDYVLRDMDISTTGSRLRGHMTFGIGAPLVAVKNVDVVAQPIDFELIEALSGAPLPLPWRGTLNGTLKASGGPLDRFQVESADLVFRDANVPGAVTVGRANGELNIEEPSLATFRSFRIDLDQLDLRTLQFLSPDFPRLNGLIAGRATLDSVWTDVRFREADITHREGTTDVSHVTGAGRVTFEENATVYDVALQLEPFSFTGFNRAYVGGRVPLRGEYTGPLRLQGTTSDLALSTELRGPAGTIGYDGRVDADSVGGYSVVGVLRFDSLNLAVLTDSVRLPSTELNGVADLDLTGDSLANLRGRGFIELERSMFDSVRIFGDSTRARFRFADARLTVDTLHLETVAGTVTAGGALGITRDVSDTLRFSILVDSLGGWRRYLARAPAATEAAAFAEDTLLGSAAGNGFLVGSIESPDMVAELNARALQIRGTRARGVRATFDLTNLGDSVSGRVNVDGDTVDVGGTRLDRVGGGITLEDGSTGEYSLLAESANGAVVHSVGGLAFEPDTTLVRIDSLGVLIGDHRLTLTRPAFVRIDTARVVVDSLMLAGPRGERLRFAADIPDRDSIRIMLSADSLHLSDIGTLTQAPQALGGVLSTVVNVSGTREAPVIDVNATATGASVGTVSLAQIVATAHYDARRLLANVKLTRGDTLVAEANANIPYDLSLHAREKRLLSDTLRVTVRSSDVDLGIVESFTPLVRDAGGRFSANLDVAGPEGGRKLDGTLTVTDGAAILPDLGIRLQRVNVALDARSDTLFFTNLTMSSDGPPGNSLRLGGWVAHPLTPDDLIYQVELNANEFHAIGRRRLANLNISVRDLRLVGPFSEARASGVVTVNSGTIAIPEFSGKELFTIENPEILGIDTTAFARLNLLPKAPPRFLAGLSAENVQIVMGDDVWLESDEARIKLSGSVGVTVSLAERIGAPPDLALEGRLETTRGTYRLSLGPVQKLFTIEGGELRFFGDPGFNPLLNISALHTVRQVSTTYGARNDVRIRVRLQGTLARPSLDLEDADALGLPESDLISYLFVGRPSVAISGDIRQDAQIATALVFGSLSSWLSSRWSGGLFDYVQIQTAADPFRRTTASERTSFDLFEGAQLGVGRQVGDRTFVSLTAGLCQFQQALAGGTGSSLSPFSIASSLGVKVEHQLGGGFGASASIEPPFSALLCTSSAETSISAAFRQIGFDLFRVWRF